jgi:hypothetical protein
MQDKKLASESIEFNQKNYPEIYSKFKFDTLTNDIDNAPKCGDLILMDPRSGIRWPEIKEYNVVHTTSSNKNTGTTAKRVYRVSPEKDMLILFPGYLLHSVETNLNPMFIRKSVGINFRVVTERW